MAGRTPKHSWSVGLEHRQGKPVAWRIFLPVLGPDRKPIAGRRRDVVRLDPRLTQKQVEKVAQQMYLSRLMQVDGPHHTYANLIETLVDYYERAVVGPRPKSAGTAKITRYTIGQISRYLHDKIQGQLSHPSPPDELLPDGLNAEPKMYAHIWNLIDQPLETFDHRQVSEFSDYLCRQLSATSVNMVLRSLKAAMSWAIEQDLIDVNPVRRGAMVPAGTVTAGARQRVDRKRHLTWHELTRFFAVIDGDARLFCQMLYLTGARASQLRALTPAHIDRERGVLSIPSGKTKGHIVLWMPQMEKLLADWTGWSYITTTYTQQVRRVLNELGIDLAQPLHGFRHTLSTVLREHGGLPLDDIARWVGHALPGQGKLVTGAYDHSHMEALKRVAKAIQIPWD
jgi:integrase